MIAFRVAARLILLALCVCACTYPDVPPKRVIVFNARIETMDELGPRNATAVGIREGRIVVVGSDAKVFEVMDHHRPIARATGAVSQPVTTKDIDVIDARGAFLMPGFIEAHAHFRNLGRSLRVVDLKGCTSEGEMVARVVNARGNGREGAWITGRGWDQNLWSERSLPTHHALSRAFPDRPVVLTRVDGHAILANAAAMTAAGVGENTPDPRGGEIVRGDDGKATGVFVDAATSLVQRAAPRASEATIRADLNAAARLAISKGITTFHDAGTDWKTVSLMQDHSDWPRLYVMIGGSGAAPADLEFDTRSPIVDDEHFRLTVRALKVGIDGALGSRGAALLEDYSDRPGHRGLLMLDEDELFAFSREAFLRGWQVCVHAIGDRANRIVLDAWERLARDRRNFASARFRVEHAQILDRADISRFAELGVVASMQTNHATSDLPWAVDRLGQERIEEGAYAWRELLESGAAFCNGTDAPVEDVDPIANLYAAIARDWGQGPPVTGYHARQRLTRMQALESYTTGGAWAGFQDNHLGRIAPGFLADFILIDRDLRSVRLEEFKESRVLGTFIGGEKIYEAEDHPIEFTSRMMLYM